MSQNIPKHHKTEKTSQANHNINRLQSISIHDLITIEINYCDKQSLFMNEMFVPMIS